MTTTAKHLLSEIVAGLDGVLYGGEWEVGDLEQRRPYSPHFELMNETDIFAYVYCGHNDPEEVKGTVAHIARLSPDRIRAIAAYVEQLEKALERLASTEAFTVPFFRRDNPEGRELLARIEFARAALGGSNE
ncbi:hypothetical protein [Ensifer sp. SL37]|uniref:hypothetical protein n=1 Tax=Ensifer sp. SL37 TaxID=2995137 RepID=UPI0022748C8F|nr:hypothetical protein [Ensifer sp. SL37]MCY1741203.1 hypothetical protein [Ensifer sp. SL37]